MEYVEDFRRAITQKMPCYGSRIIFGEISHG